MRNLFVNVTILILTFCLIFILAEISVRIYQLLRYQRPLIYSRKVPGLPSYIDSRICWRATEYFSFEGKLRDAVGKEYHAEITTNKYGFRLFGDLKSDKPRILFIGDSFTHALDVSDDKTYYALISTRLKDYEVFAYGVGGYGTLQEMLILDEFWDIINLNILVLQFCCNDFVNNNYFLERSSFINNNGNYRPYFDQTGSIFYNNPRHSILPHSLISFSRLFALIDYKIAIILAKTYGAITIEKMIEKGEFNENYKQSVMITNKLFNMIKDKFKPEIIITFSADYKKTFMKTIKKYL